MLGTPSRSHFLHITLFLLASLSPLPQLHSLSFNITNFDNPTTPISYEGDGRSNNGSIDLNKVIDLCRVGRAIYSQPIQLWDSSSGILTDFTTHFTFTIEKMNSTSMGDGFAFYLAPLGYQIPPNSAGSTFALFNATPNNNLPHNHVVAVEFDTSIGSSTDPPMKHVGIDDNSITSVAVARFDIDNNLGRKCYTLVKYTASTKTLFVSWSFKGSVGTKNNDSSLSYQIDLMKILPEFVNVGFSASTGASTESNVIHSWDFSSTLNSTSLDDGNIEHKGSKTVVLVVAVVCPLILVIGAVVVTVLLIMKKRRVSGCDDEQHGLASVKFDLDRATIPRRFDYEELVAATNGFANDNRLGQGASGQVYKGVLSYLGRVVAVKRIFVDFENSERIFINEVRIISRLIHKNLVQFIGWCHEHGEFLLVFEYMPNGSLNNHLFGNKRTLEWHVRYKVALGVVTALRYLHEDAEQCVLHRDIKSANVLLDNDFSTKIGDFGTAKLVDSRLRSQMTELAGTYGYMAPEYINEGRVSKKSDMYSFGVVALEIACGRRTYQDGEFHVPLTHWVWQQYVEGKVESVADEGLKKDFDEHEMRCLLTVGLWCTHLDDKERPSAESVIKVLKQELPLPMLPHDMRVRPPHLFNRQTGSLQSSPITVSLTNVGR